MALVFGFDIGTTSIGFAVIDHDPGQGTGKIHRLGVRIFPEARDPKALVPLNQDRRGARMRRRHLRRRRQRRQALGALLHQHGFLPRRDSCAWNRVMGSDPYLLRKWAFNLQQANSHESRSQVLAAMQAGQAKLPAWALEGERLSPHAVGRAVYHLAQRRHFKGRDIDEIASDDGTETSSRDGDQEETDKQAMSARDDTQKALQQEGKTLGAWLAEQGPKKRKRGVHALRQNVEDEFDQVWAPRLPNDRIREEVRRVIFDQRPVFWRVNTLGTCRFLPEKKGLDLCPRGSWLSQQRRMLEKLNNLQFVSPEQRCLDEEERQAILTKLQTQASMTWAGVRKALAPLYRERNQGGEEKRLKFNLQQGGEKKLLGNMIEKNLADIFGEAWKDHPHRQDIREALHERLWTADYGTCGEQRVVIRPAKKREERREQAARYFIETFGLSDEQAEKIKALKLPTGWEPYSTEALQKILPLLETGVRFGEIINGPDLASWREETFPNHQGQTSQGFDRLPSPKNNKQEQEHIASLRNPTVARARNELRKVVNNLIDMFGKPDLICVELARDVGLSKREREEKQTGMKRQEKCRNAARENLQERGISEPSRDHIEKWMLWEECGHQCPYTGDHISFEALFQNNEFEVEHIWPRSHSLDDSFRNKTLCRRDFNRQKGNQIPFNFLAHNQEQWAAVMGRLDNMKARRRGDVGMSTGKIKRFLAQSIPDGFSERQLNDTGYAAREAVAYLKQLWPDQGSEGKGKAKVQAVSGRLTAHLRRLWGLNNILGDTGEKNRADHRHHAVDALTVACTHPGMTQKLSRYWQDKDNPRAQEPQLSPPWKTIRKDAEEAVDAIIVSHRVRKKVSGRLHKETVYGDTGEEETTSKITYRLFATRKNVEALSRKELKEQIRDDEVGRIVRDWVEKYGGDPKKAFQDSSYPTLGDGGPEIRKVRLLVKQQIKLMAPVKSPKGYADKDGNHHVAIYRLSTGEIVHDVVSLLDVSRRLAKREPIVKKERSDGAKFIMSLSKGESLELKKNNENKIRIVTAIAAKGQVRMVDHNDATSKETEYSPRIRTVAENAKKVSVDPIGRVRPAND
ncbi:MAG: type II CRISPR RNA-guided endonuclease Cas9 [Synechococcus sp. SB0678_bin_12]|nr:type II CRISPR RNA-guided endonuclease Cas9 [Synechococcus sp. SB0678_bin_12]MYI87154.1 type II CRISPR RNA-guided endonuclease Cas9 [Synechococcus sp. SB0672_bin_10]